MRRFRPLGRTSNELYDALEHSRRTDRRFSWQDGAYLKAPNSDGDISEDITFTALEVKTIRHGLGRRISGFQLHLVKSNTAGGVVQLYGLFMVNNPSRFDYEDWVTFETPANATGIYRIWVW